MTRDEMIEVMARAACISEGRDPEREIWHHNGEIHEPYGLLWEHMIPEISAALKAENERLREELRVTEEASHAFISSFNPHELPSGKEDQWHASIEQCRRARTALETTNG